MANSPDLNDPENPKSELKESSTTQHLSLSPKLNCGRLKESSTEIKKPSPEPEIKKPSPKFKTLMMENYPDLDDIPPQCTQVSRAPGCGIVLGLRHLQPDKGKIMAVVYGERVEFVQTLADIKKIVGLHARYAPDRRIVFAIATGIQDSDAAAILSACSTSDRCLNLKTLKTLSLLKLKTVVKKVDTVDQVWDINLDENITVILVIGGEVSNEEYHDMCVVGAVRGFVVGNGKFESPIIGDFKKMLCDVGGVGGGRGGVVSFPLEAVAVAVDKVVEKLKSVVMEYLRALDGSFAGVRFRA